MSIEFKSEIEVSLILKCKDSFFNLLPEQVPQLVLVIKSSIKSLVFPDLNFIVFFINPVTPLYFVCQSVPGYFVDSTATSMSFPKRISSKISSGIFLIGVDIFKPLDFSNASIFLKTHISLYSPRGNIPPRLILKLSSSIIFSFKILSSTPSPLQESHQP